MDNKNDFMRIEGHPEPLEIQEHYAETTKAAATAGAKGKKAGKARKGRPDRVGDFIWAGVAAICVLALVGVVYFLSGTPNRDKEAQGTLTAYNADEIIEGSFYADGYGTDEAYAMAGEVERAVPAAAATDADADAVYFFPTNGSAIPEDDALNAVAETARKSGAYVTVTAYTDETGREEYNRRLSERRAESVGKYLVAHGVAADHVTTKGMGETHAYATNALDRRAEVRIN